MLILYIFTICIAIILSFIELGERKRLYIKGYQGGILDEGWHNNIKPLSWVKPALFILSLFLIYMSANRPNTMPDYIEYVRIFTEEDLFDSRYEIGNIIIISIIRFFTHDPHVFFFVFAVFGIGIKTYAIYRFSSSVFLSYTIYLSVYFVLLDMIQVRNSMAISFYLLALISRCQGKWKSFWLFACLSVLFHYTALIALILLTIFHDSKRIQYYKWVIPISYLLYFGGFTLGHYASLLPGVYQSLWEINSLEVKDVNVFNAVQLCRIALFYVIYSNHKVISQSFPYVTIMLKIYATAICFLVLFSDVAGIAGRMSHFLCAVEIFLLPSIVYIRSWKGFLHKILIYAYCIGSLIIFIFSEDNRL